MQHSKDIPLDFRKQHGQVRLVKLIKPNQSRQIISSDWVCLSPEFPILQLVKLQQALKSFYDDTVYIHLLK